MKEIKDNINRWRGIPYSWVGRINIVRVTILPHANYRFNAIPITNGIFHRTRTKKFPIHMETQKTPNSQSSLKKEVGAGGINLPDFRLYYKASHQDSMVTSTKPEIQTNGTR